MAHAVLSTVATTNMQMKLRFVQTDPQISLRDLSCTLRHAYALFDVYEQWHTARSLMPAG